MNPNYRTGGIQYTIVYNSCSHGAVVENGSQFRRFVGTILVFPHANESVSFWRRGSLNPPFRTLGALGLLESGNETDQDEGENASPEATHAKGIRNGGAQKATAAEHGVSGQPRQRTTYSGTIRSGGGGGLCLLAVELMVVVVGTRDKMGKFRYYLWVKCPKLAVRQKRQEKRSRPAGDNSVREMNIRY